MNAPSNVGIMAAHLRLEASNTRRPSNIVSQLKEGIDVSVNLGSLKHLFTIVSQYSAVCSYGYGHFQVELDCIQDDHGVRISSRNRRFKVEGNSVYMTVTLKLEGSRPVPSGKNRIVADELAGALCWLLNRNSPTSRDAKSIVKTSFDVSIPDIVANDVKSEVLDYVSTMAKTEFKSKVADKAGIRLLGISEGVKFLTRLLELHKVAPNCYFVH